MMARKISTTKPATPNVVFISLLLQALILANAIAQSVGQQDSVTCSNFNNTFCENNNILRPFDPDKHKPVYRVGVLAIRGFENAYKEFNKTFGDYLSSAVGNRFFSIDNATASSPRSPPIRFELKPLNFNLLFTDVYAQIVDFIYVNPSAYACIEAEVGANSLVSQISLRKVGGEQYQLTKFGGVIMTLANNTSINMIEDIRGKSIAAASISGLGSGQMQFRKLIGRGMSYINDPSQVIFTSNQGKVVNGVLYGEIDVGFVRTDQIERTKDRETGELVDKSLFKILEPEVGLEIDGVPFPFESSTPLYPEWNIASLPHVPDDVAREVQKVLLDLESQALIGSRLQQCYTEKCNGTDTACIQDCDVQIMNEQEEIFPCDTSVSLALTANEAKQNGKYVGFRSTLSYMELRNMQEDTGFISLDDDSGLYKCIRSSGIYDAIVCPVGHFKQNVENVLNGCDNVGLDCYGFQCVCRPCMKAFDVDVFPIRNGLLSDVNDACAKMDVCGKLEQKVVGTFTFIDNRKRDNVNFEVKLIRAKDEKILDVTSLGNYTYQFLVSSYELGISILEILADDEQISQSPMRVEIVSLDCARIYNDKLLVADDEGNCICQSGSININGCMAYSTFFPVLLTPLAAILILCGFAYIEFKRRKHDSIWRVVPSELEFDDPPIVIGRGTFGLVLLSTYRGTTVAVKRVIPPKTSSGKDERNSKLGTGDLLEHHNRTSSIVSQRRRISNYMDNELLDALRQVQNEMGEENPQPKTALPLALQLPSKISLSRASSSLHTNSSTQNSFMYSKSGNFTAFGNGKNSSSDSRSSNSLKWGFKRFRGDEYTRLKKDFISEMRQLSKLRHPCITTVMGAVIDRGEEPMLVMEFMQLGSLYDLLHNESMLIEGEIVLPILRDVVQGLRFLHSYEPPVIHGDLKAQNILVDSKLRAKVADFGLSQKKRVGATGTPFWMAPELLTGKSYNTVKSDCYSFGIMLYEIYSRKEPYEGEDPQMALRQVCDPNINKRPPIPKTCPPKMTAIMTECVHVESKLRPSFEEIDDRLKRLDTDAVEPGLNMISKQLSKMNNANKNERLLLEVFPENIAHALREGRKIEPEHHEMVTVFLSDIVGYTKISSNLSPTKVSDMLDRLYLKFDDLSRKHNVFKIETIGDAYMAVTNLVKNQEEDHVLRLVQFAKDTIKASESTLIDVDRPKLGHVRIRIGLHTGPVVSNVVGSRNPKFTIIGDTVNAAARMESNSLPMRIQSSEATAKILIEKHPEIPCVCRGSIPIKGKGEMTTYWVHSSEHFLDNPETAPRKLRFQEGSNRSAATIQVSNETSNGASNGSASTSKSKNSDRVFNDLIGMFGS